MFRSTDAEVTKFYAKSPRPYGTVVSGDGFKRGFIRSGTDYTVCIVTTKLLPLVVGLFLSEVSLRMAVNIGKSAYDSPTPKHST